MQRAKTISYSTYHNRAYFFWILVTVSILSLSVYIYAINTTARNVALQQVLEKQMAKVSASLDPLEFAYIELKNNITIELAHDYGFRETKSPLYVSRLRATTLSFNTQHP